MRITEAPILFLNETGNASMTIGVTLNQNGNDDEIVALKSSDVAHGATALTETDTFGSASKAQATSGGLKIAGYKDADGNANRALQLCGYLAEAAAADKTTSGRAVVEVHSYRTSGTGLTDINADGNLFAIRTQRGGSEVTVFIVDEDGDLYYDGSTSSYDEEDDMLMLRDLGRLMAGADDEIERYDRKSLEARGVIGTGKAVDETGRFMLSHKNVTSLLCGAFLQLRERLATLD